MMKALSEGRVAITASLRAHVNVCLGCRACESACPSGVQYGQLIEITRIALEETRTPRAPERVLRRIALRELMPNTGRLRAAAWLMRLYERLGIQSLVRTLNLLPKRLKAAEALLPPATRERPNYQVAAPAKGTARGSVAFFYGCIQDAFLADVNAATIRVLQRNGYSVHFPQGQTCCGAAQVHLGEADLGRRLARQNIDAFPVEEFDAIISNAGGCGAVLKDYGRLLEDDPDYAERARAFAAKVKDISEFLADRLHVPPQGKIKARVTYVDSCHLRHAQKVVLQPRTLLQRIPGIELIELKQPDRCCGSAGVYNILQVDVANALLDAKMADIESTGADTVVVTNTGCHLQVLAGVRRAKRRPRVVHLVELLDGSYSAES